MVVSNLNMPFICLERALEATIPGYTSVPQPKMPVPEPVQSVPHPVPSMPFSSVASMPTVEAPSSLQQAASGGGTGSESDDAYFNELDLTIQAAKNAVVEHKFLLGSMADEEMPEVDAPEKKKRGRGETASPGEGTKQFFIASWRVEEAVQQIGGSYVKWFIESVPEEFRVDEINVYVAKAMDQLPPEKRQQVLAIPNKEQIPAIYVFLEETKQAKYDADYEEEEQKQKEITEKLELMMMEQGEQDDSFDSANMGELD